jgi:hypothetical protein
VENMLETSLELALNPSTAPELLEQLALHQDAEVRQKVAGNPNTPSSVLFKLAEEFPGEFFNNPVFPLLSLENPHFYKVIPDNTLRNLLVHESVPDGWFEWASSERNIQLLYSVVANPITSRNILENINTYDNMVCEEKQMHVNYSGEITSGWHDVFQEKFQLWKKKHYSSSEKMVILWDLGIIHQSQLLQLPSKVKRNIIKQTNSPQLIETILTNRPSKRIRLACAENIFTPVSYLIKLACDNDNEVREGAMCNPNIPREIIQEYYQQHMISNHPNSQSHELTKLIYSKWWFIRANTAKHPNLSLDDLEIFLSDSDLNVRASAALNPNISINGLEKLVKDKSVYVRCSVAQNLKTPIHCLEKLSCDRNEEVRACVAFNPNISSELNNSIKANLSSEILKKYSKSKLSDKKEYSIAVNAATPLTELISIYRKPTIHSQIRFEAIKNICQQLMCNSNVSPEQLAELLPISKESVGNIILYTVIGYHQNANSETCERLINYYNLKLRCSVVQNPNISIKVLEKLLQHNNNDIRLSAFKAYQERYAKSENTSNFLIELEAAKHPNTPPEKLSELTKSKWALVREALAAHPRAGESYIITKGKKTSLTILNKLSKDTRQSVKIAVAKNSNTSIEILEALIKADNYNSKVSTTALKYLLEKAPDRAEKHLLHYHQWMCKYYFYVDLCIIILQHSSAPISLLKNKLRLLSWMERYTITQNLKTSQDILEMLAKDANCVVRAAAKERLDNMNISKR